jgi:uncharacterized membrane protein
MISNAFSGTENFQNRTGGVPRSIRSFFAVLCFIVSLVLCAGPALAVDPYSISLSVTGIYNFLPAVITNYHIDPDEDPLEVTVYNTGNRDTGNLDVDITGPGADAFTISAGSVENIAASDDDGNKFKVTPKEGLGADTYTATVTVSGHDHPEIIPQSFNVSFTVTSAVETYAIALSRAVYNFPSATVGYGPQAALSVTVTNTGNQATGALDVDITGLDSSAFTWQGALPSIVVRETGDFSVTPREGLPIGTYTATVTVSGGHSISESFNVSFTVTGTGGGGGGEEAGGGSMGCNAFFSPLFAAGLLLAVKGVKKIVRR